MEKIKISSDSDVKPADDDNDTIEFSDNKYLYSWGFGKYGQIGVKFANYSLTPIKQIIDEKEEIFLIAGGESHSAILTLSSKLYLYGKNHFGQLGIGHNHYVYSPLKLELSDRVKISKVACGGDHTLALTEENVLYTWGLNVFGQLGLGDYLARKTPIKVRLISHGDNSQQESILLKHEEIVDISAGAQHSMILTNKNRILTCGYAKFNSLGYESEEDVNIFRHIQSGITYKNSISKISCGVFHSGCIADNDVVYIWGKGDILIYEKPTQITINEIISGSNNTIVIRDSNLTISTLNSSPTKKQSHNNFIRDLKIGEDIVYILTKQDEVYAMGDNKYGQLGIKQNSQNVKNIGISNSNPGNQSSVGIPFRKTLEKVDCPKIKQIEVGYNFVLLVTFENKIYGWGSNEYGQLGLTTMSVVHTPTLLEEISNLGVYKIACGGYHSLGLFNVDIGYNLIQGLSQGQIIKDENPKNIETKNTLNAEDANHPKEPTTPITQSLEEHKKVLKIIPLNSTMKKDYLTQSEKYKFMENMKKRISELENSLIVKESQIKELKQKDEELSKKMQDSDPRQGDSSSRSKSSSVNNPRGFDNPFEITLEEIEFAEDEGEIGRGTFGDVRRGVWRKEHVAVKFLKQEMTTSEDNVNGFIEECNMLKNLRHPNILLFMGASCKAPYYFVVTEFCENGNLFELMHQHKNIALNWDERRRIALEVALGMNYLHSFEPPILHRDLKSMNVLLDKNFQVKIADFGSTKFLEVQMTKQKGTFQWMAPEVIKSSSYTEKADVFSFAIIMHELASRQPPYYGVDKKEVARNVATKPEYRPAVSRSYPREFVELMVKCWDHNPSKRPNFGEIIDSLIKMKLTK